MEKTVFSLLVVVTILALFLGKSLREASSRKNQIRSLDSFSLLYSAVPIVEAMAALVIME